MRNKPFGELAPEYWGRGLSVVPLEPGTKRPAIKGWQGLCNEPPGPSKRQDLIGRYAACGIGLLTGVETRPGERLGAVDVDQDEFVRVVEVILCLN